MRYGRLAPHPEHTHPRVWLHTVWSGPVSVQLPTDVDWASSVSVWPMLLNDQLGDCTCAGALHMFQAMKTYAGSPFTPTDTQALHMYEQVAGYNPVTGANDNGAVEQDVLQWLHDTGIDGHQIVAFAQVDHTNAALMKHALAEFGSVYVGIQCPQSMEQQFAAGQVIDYVPGSPVEGGHCIIIQRWDANYLYVVTWGRLVRMTWEFWAHYGDEAWVVVTRDFLEASGKTPSGFDIQALVQDFKTLQAGPPPSPRHAKPSVDSWLVRAWKWIAERL